MNDDHFERRIGRTVVYLAWVVVMAYFFANAEIQIEGGAGWATSLPTVTSSANACGSLAATSTTSR